MELIKFTGNKIQVELALLKIGVIPNNPK